MRKDGRKILKNYGTAYATFVDNYDGDTFRADLKALPAIVGRYIPVRIANINAPEMYKGNKSQILRAASARDLLRTILSTAKVIRLVGIKRGKYFRLVANVLADGKDVGTLMLRSGFADKQSY